MKVSVLNTIYLRTPTEDLVCTVPNCAIFRIQLTFLSRQSNPDNYLEQCEKKNVKLKQVNTIILE